MNLSKKRILRIAVVYVRMCICAHERHDERDCQLDRQEVHLSSRDEIYSQSSVDQMGNQQLSLHPFRKSQGKQKRRNLFRVYPWVKRVLGSWNLLVVVLNLKHVVKTTADNHLLMPWGCPATLWPHAKMWLSAGHVGYQAQLLHQQHKCAK